MRFRSGRPPLQRERLEPDYGKSAPNVYIESVAREGRVFIECPDITIRAAVATPGAFRFMPGVSAPESIAFN